MKSNIFNIVTITPILQRTAFEKFLFAYFPITFLDDVRYICVKIVMGSWMLNIICEYTRPLNGSLIKKININAMIRVIPTPNFVWLSLISYGSFKEPVNILPPAIPAVTEDDIPEKSNARANITAAAFPRMGVSIWYA